ncbi:hypothetical protein OY671_012497, partial [Metschnikowia pulcherrima]
AGPFDSSGAITSDKLNEMGQARALEQILSPLRAGSDDIPALALSPDQAGALRQGRVLVGVHADDGAAFAMLDSAPVASVDVIAGEVRVRKQASIKEHAREEGDTGSPEVQVAIMTDRIKNSTEHFKGHAKDN